MTNEITDDDEFDVISDNEITTVHYGENLNQGHEMMLGARIKLALPEMVQLKDIIDGKVNPDYTAVKASTFTSNKAVLTEAARISPSSPKLHNIPVTVETIGERVLVKVGPCDLSGVGGHSMREQIIKNVVEQALEKDGLQNNNFESVNVSACVGVRGRLQMLCGFFTNNRENTGSHMNAYIKVAGEQNLTHWEPRKGPQRWYNDTICAMVTSTTTSIFEKKVREGSITSSQKATAAILKNPSLVKIFDDLLAKTHDRITKLVEDLKEHFSSDGVSERDESDKDLQLK